MNYVKNIIACIALAVSMQSLFAEHKEMVYVVNHYGEEVVVNLKWSPKPNSYSYFDKDQEFSVYEDDRYDDALEDHEFDLRFQHKAPLSKYYLSEIAVVSAADKMERYQKQIEATASHDPYSTTNRYSMPTPIQNEVKFKFLKPSSKNLFFVVEVDEQKSRQLGKKQMKLSRYLSRDVYRKELAKTNPGLLVHKKQPMQTLQPSYQQTQPTQIVTQPQIIQNEYNNASNQQYRYELRQDDEFGGIDFHGFGG